jgi:hypothetical protein
MMKRKVIAIITFSLLLIISSTVNANQIIDLKDHTDNQLPFPPGPNFFPGGVTEGYLISSPDWGWTHTFEFEGPLPPSEILSATLEIRQFGVGLYDEHEIFFDGESLGFLDNGFPYETSHTTVFNLGASAIANLMDETVDVWLDIDWPNSVAIYWSRLTTNYVREGLDYIEISGPTEVQEDTSAQYTCTAYFTSGPPSNVTNSASWSQDSPFATIDSMGFLTTSLILQDEPCQIKATFGGKTDTHDITIKNVVPIVSITESIPTAAEAGIGGVLEVSRVGTTKETLRVFYTTAGSTAIPDVDYTALPGFVDIPIDETSVAVFVGPIDDSIEEGPETVKLSLIPDATYDIDPILFSATVTIADDEGESPVITGFIPAINSVQIPRDTIIQLQVTDDSSGVGEVTILVEGDLIYDGSVLIYDSTGDVQAVKGTCRRVSTGLDDVFVFQPSTLFDFEQEVDVEVTALDKVGHLTTESYSFFTMMRTFGINIKVNTDAGTTSQHHPATAMDSSGNIWVVWEHEVAPGDSDIYIGKLPVGESAFELSQIVYSDPSNQLNPAIAIDPTDDSIYVTWQGNDLTGFWDIFISTSTDGTSWSVPVKVNSGDPDNDNSQTLPAIAIDSTGMAYITWEDNSKGSSDKDIWVASSSDATTWTSELIADAIGNQTEPVIDIVEGLAKVPYVFWTDGRSINTDIIAKKKFITWTEDQIVITPSNQSSPAASITESSNIHLLWVDDESGFVGMEDIFYGNSDLGLPIQGISIVDEPGTEQKFPSIAANDERVFACWRDSRNVAFNADYDIYFAEKSTGDFGTNILVNDDLGQFTQRAPVVNIDITGNPYLVWVDDREGNNDIYATSATSVGPVLRAEDIDAAGGIVEIKTNNPGVVDDKDDVIIEIPPGVLPTETRIKISKLINPPSLPPGGFGVIYEFGPSGLVFNQPVTITIAHAAADCPGHEAFLAYFYNTETGTWSLDGISNVEHLTNAEDPSLPADVHAVRFNADHFTAFGTGGGAAGGSGGVVGGGGGGGGGGCSMSAECEGNIVEYFLPYIGFIIVLVVLTVRDARVRKVSGR